MLNIGYFADGKWGLNCFKQIIHSKKISIKFVVLRYANPDLKLMKLARKKYIDCYIEQDVNHYSFIEKISKYNVDLLVSMSFDQIFKQPILDLYKNKIINCHAGKLPEYRGRNILNWALINGEKDFGITVHFVNEKIDDGDIILQKILKIKENYNYKMLLKISAVECSRLLFDALKLFVNNKVTSYKQNLKNGFYCKRRKSGDEIINWNDKRVNIHNFIKGVRGGGISAISYIQSNKIKIFKSEIVDMYMGNKKNGEVVKANKKHIYINTIDGILKIISYKADILISKGDILN
ncbi:methionyl-tRNA formyltransferase [Campylobacter lari]|nr:methionyl-tRNA formyltransferase [Campylobacter lari]EAJ5674913.1 methionyl-tRNA formyltransferase [Campylobacter lari]EAK5586205.1 methionyl-tRNA formyltransferase [Campylobacter lari]EAK5785693.1 methionyl-tRNA formyltransferase [Campylobacter lari]EAK9878821.1 methionyl-tRNA formyltransferase [Campylobacter lari]